jgi:hypothetical protein
MNGWRALTRRARHLAAGKYRSRTRWKLHGAMFQQATLIVWFFYIATAYFLYDGSRTFSHVVDAEESLDLLWPVAWLSAVGLDRGGKIVAHIGLAAALLCLLWWRMLAVRILVSVALLLYAAFANSYGAINHGHHEWFWISVCFWLLPGGRAESLTASRVKRMEFMTAFSLAPLLILLFYTLSGVYKCYYALAAFVHDRVGGFSPDAMAITTAGRAFQTGSQPMWAEFAIGYPVLSWPFYLGLYFAEIVSLLVFFRPQLHRAWGVALIMFHFGTLLLMDIVFGKHVLINGMLFVMSPFALGRHSLHQQIGSIPFLGAVYALIRNPKLVDPLLKPKPGRPTVGSVKKDSTVAHET